jgi:hypothetical protein
MGYRGKVEEQERARVMRADGMTLLDIAQQLGVSKSSVSLWVRDVEFTPSPRRYGAQRRPHPAHEARLRQIEELDAEGIERIGVLTDDAFLAAGVALYAGEGTKREGAVRFANTDPAMVRSFVRGCGGSSRSMRRACGCACTCTRVWTSTRHKVTGLR